MQRFAISYHGEDLEIEVCEGTDLDSDFPAQDAETGEPLIIHGWMIDDFAPVYA